MPSFNPITLAATALLAQQAATAPSTCTFAPRYSAQEILKDPKPFIADVLHWEGKFTQPGIGYNGANGMTYDGTLLDQISGLAPANAAGRHNFSAASKESLHVMVLAKAIAGSGDAARFVSPDDPGKAGDLAFGTLGLKLKTYLDFNRTYPGFGGFLPWYNNTNAAIEPTSDWVDRVPGLDNGELLWAVYAAVQALETSRKPEYQALARQWQAWLDFTKSTVARIFYHGGAGSVCAVVTLDQTLAPDNPGQNYSCEGSDRLDDPYEGELFTWWLYFFGDLPKADREALWVRKRAKLQSVEYSLNGIGPVTVQKGFWFSSHEQWKILEMPYFDVSLVKRLFTNAERVRTCNSKTLGIPGTYASVNNVTDDSGQIIGYISNAGIPSISSQTVQELDVVTPYAVFPTLLVEGKKGLGVGMAWWWNMVTGKKMQNPYGSTESERVDGTAVSSFVSWDSKITTVAALLGGVSDLVKARMVKEKIYQDFIRVTKREHERVFKGLRGENVALCLPDVRVPDAGLDDYTAWRCLGVPSARFFAYRGALYAVVELVPVEWSTSVKTQLETCCIGGLSGDVWKRSDLHDFADAARGSRSIGGRDFPPLSLTEPPSGPLSATCTAQTLRPAHSNRPVSHPRHPAPCQNTRGPCCNSDAHRSGGPALHHHTLQHSVSCGRHHEIIGPAVIPPAAALFENLPCEAVGNALGARLALSRVADWGQRPCVQVPIPLPNDTNNPMAGKKATAKSGDLAQKLARSKSQEFKSKILDWNQAGGGIAVEQDPKTEAGKGSGTADKAADLADEVVVFEEEDGTMEAAADVKANGDPTATPGPSKSPTPAAKAHARRTSKDIDRERKAWVRRKSKPQVETIPQEEDVDADIKAATTPKKRVVSDGHWRRDRSASKPQSGMPTPEKDETPKPITIRRSVVNVGLKVPPSVHDFIDEPQPDPVRRRPISSHGHSRPKSREEREGTPDYEDSGTKVYIKRRPRSKTSAEDPRRVDSEGSSLVSMDHKSASTDITTPSTPPAKEIKRKSATEPREKTSSRSLRAEEASKRQENKKAKAPEVQKRSSHKPEPKPAPLIVPNVPKVFGTRIEGWLATTSDPFNESELTPEPLAPRKTPKKKTPEKEGYFDSRSQSPVRKRRSKPNLERIDTERIDSRSASPQSMAEGSEVSGASTPTLKRRGARRNTHSPVKDRGRHASSPLDSATITTTDIADMRPRSRSGHQLSEVGSMDTLTQSELRAPNADGGRPQRKPSEKRGLTKHSDLISVLSMPVGESKGITSARSIRTQRVRSGAVRVGDVMTEVNSDELKYQRELRTLVDGVIPVLLQSVLSQKNAAGNIKTSTGLTKDEPTVTQPIVNMGVALERLRASHKRIPMQNPLDLVNWAQQTAKIYDDYLQAWRLGFADLVVTLAPADGAEKDRQPFISSKAEEQPNSNEKGDGERVEVAYLLKRPLVRLKYLARSLKFINQIESTPASKDMATRYQDLVEEARNRSNDERARLEDEAAAAIDPTRSRDLRSLAPISGVRIDPTRCVRARDYFDMDLRHSSGQQLTCRIEIIIRDDLPSRGKSTDLLFCEVTTTGRWLLFPPVLTSMVSVRTGKQEGELVLMIRGFQARGKEWREIMSLRTDDDEAIDEWLDMLPESPVPPSLMKKSSFDMLKGATMSGALPMSPASPEPNVKDVQVPIGERAHPSAQMWDGSDVNSMIGDDELVNTPLRRAKAHRHRTSPVSPLAHRASHEADETYAWERKDTRPRPTSLYSASIDDRPKTSYTRSTTEFTPSILSRSTTDYSESSGYTASKRDYSVWLPSSQGNSSEESNSEDEYEPPMQRPGLHRKTSSVPSLDLPTISRTRPGPPLERRVDSQPIETPRKRSSHRRSESTPIAATQEEREPASAPAKMHSRRLTPPKEHERSGMSREHSRPTSKGLKSSIIPSFTPNFLKKNRRSSSPLKHEYAPSTGSESFTESEYSDIEDDESITSESSPEDEQISTIGELKTFPNVAGYKPMAAQPSPPDTQYSPSDPSLAPSQSASQAPYRTVPQYDDKATTTIASIFAWVDSGLWDSLHPEECCIVVSPGLIEAFDIAQASTAPGDADKSPSTRGVKPLIALELTPLVPLRRGTALDISVRSPPTANSLYKPGANVMFRSRNGEECEALYFMINRARINNPTYIALQNARGPMQQSNWGEAMDRRNQARTSPSWWNLGSRKGSTYRSKGTRRTSNNGTETSVGSAFSALRRFSGSGNRLFNIAKSTITSREGGGSRDTYSDSLSSGAVTPMGMDPRLGTPLGLTNMKIRLYLRETASKWRDMGSARMTIVLPPRPDPEMPADPRTTGEEKRIIVAGKTKGETLIDATLGESCFERVARTGIAVSIWEETTGPNGEVGHVAAVGGVSTARAKVYMVQMKSERETAYTFGLVGKLRY
ncbi:hypothetical protein Q7P37_010723 [Cladosporium fusiforme]